MTDVTDTTPSLELEENDNDKESSSSHEKESTPVDPLQISQNPDVNIPVAPSDKECTLTDQRIEDEDPPTFYSVSSTTKNDESEDKTKYADQESDPSEQDLNRRESPEKDDDSVCVVESSSEEEEGEDDDEDDEDSDDSDEEEDEYVNYKSRRNQSYEEDEDCEEYNEQDSKSYRKNLEDESEDVEDEDQMHEIQGRHYREQNDYEGDEDFDEEDEDDYEEDRFEPERFEGNSYDSVLRHNSSNGLNYQQKERSHSLQDVSSIKSQNPKRKNVNPFSQKARFERKIFENEFCDQIPNKQSHNANDIEDENLVVTQITSKKVQESREKIIEDSDARSIRNSEIIKVCKSMKEYTEKTVKEVEIADLEENCEINITSHAQENGELTNISKNNYYNNKVSIRNSEEMEIEISGADINGATVPPETKNTENTNKMSRKGIFRNDAPNIILNGEDEIKPYTTTRNLNYDEYMKGTTNSNEPISSDCDTNNKSNQQLQKAPITNHTLSIKNKEQEKLISMTKYLNDVTIQLHQKNSDYENLYIDYKNLRSQNAEMRNELENLRKMVINYEKQQKSKNKSVSAAAQTDTEANNITESESTKPKVHNSTQWTDDVIADTKPIDPSCTMNQGNKNESSKTSKSKHLFSQAFVTSSKILQTLSNITQRNKSYDIKTGKISNNATGTDNQETDDYELVQDNDRTNSKKRKATSLNLTELSKSAHPSKKYNMTYQETTSEDGQQANESRDDDKIKVFIYPEHGSGEDQSFLIQAKEIGDNIRPGHRECGPFVLGNIEVHMAEVNGTINIWGKEIVQETSQYVEEQDTTARSELTKSSFYWQSTPQSKILNTNHESTISNKQSTAFEPAEDMEQSHLHDHTCKTKKTTQSCESHNPHNYHSCCPTKNLSLQDDHYNCYTASPPRHSKCCHNNDVHYSPVMNSKNCCTNYIEPRRLSLPSMHNKNLYASCCKKQHQCSKHECNKNYQHQMSNPENDDSDDEVEILVSEQKHCQIKENMRSSNRLSEKFKTSSSRNQPYDSHVNEGKQKANSSKRVKGLLVDLLNGCKSVSSRTKPYQHFSKPSTSIQLATSSPYRKTENRPESHNVKNVRTIELEDQLEQFQKEMEKLKSRSNNLRDMITSLHEENKN